MGKHPAEDKPQGPNLLQPLPLQSPQPDRAVLQQDKALSPHRDPLRQARRKLPRSTETRRPSASGYAVMSLRPNTSWVLPCKVSQRYLPGNNTTPVQRLPPISYLSSKAV